MLLGPFDSFLAQCDQMVDRSCDLHLKASIFGRLQSNDHRTKGQTAAASPVRDAIVQSRPSSGCTLSSHREHVALRQDATVFLILFHLFIFVFEKVSEWRIWGKFTCFVNETGQGWQEAVVVRPSLGPFDKEGPLLFSVIRGHP